MERKAPRKAAPWIDVSVPLKNGMVHWPGDPAFETANARSLARGDSCTVSYLQMGVHSGTHMDAPAHFVLGGKTMDQLPLDAVMGPARVIDIRSTTRIEAEDLSSYRIRRGERILLKTRNSRLCWQTDDFVKDFVYISPEAAAWLADRRVKMIGVDYLSVGGFKKGGRETHLALLNAGIWIVEGLNLSGVRPGPVDLICLPLRIVGSEGAPARAVIRQKR